MNGHYRMIDGYFCGSTTPSRHFLQMIAGVSRILPRRDNRPILVNTTGLATGEIGRALKTEKINAIKPDMIIGLETGHELAYLDAFARAGAEVLKFRPHPLATTRSRAVRESLRSAAFQAHFQNAVSSVHDLDDIGVERSLLYNGVPCDTTRLSKVAGARVVHAEVAGDEAIVVFAETTGDRDKLASALDVSIILHCNAAEFGGTLVGLIDSQGELLGLGILESVDFSRAEIRIYSPVTKFSVLQFGSLKIEAGTFKTAGPFSLQVYRHKH